MTSTKEKLIAAIQEIEGVMGGGYVHRHPEVFAAIIQTLGTDNLTAMVKNLTRVLQEQKEGG